MKLTLLLFVGIECTKNMSRNITNSIEKVVKKIQDVIDNQKKYTIDGDQTSINWLKSLRIEKPIVRLFPDFYSAWLTYQNDNYLVLVNHKLQFKIPSFLEEETLNSGAWVAIIDELDLPLNKGNKEILQEIFESEWELNEKGYKKINFEQEFNGISLKDCFLNISLYKIISRFNNKEELDQITGIALTESNSYCLLPYSSDVLEEFKNTFENGNKYIPFENILASYVASDFKFAYLDLYRCIEGLQPLYFLKNFYDKLALQGTSVKDFYMIFYETTKLEPKLEDSLKKLLESININYKYVDKQNNSVGSYFYKLRNQIVHLRPKQNNDLLPKSIDYWNDLIVDILKAVQEIYQENQDLLN
ncbi:MAG TPA: hypothetical protein VK184_17850 [Nostocaceae cyanobacterium]|nr:hypothetical protein [Nostocaceae cyanobacterium]